MMWGESFGGVVVGSSLGAFVYFILWVFDHPWVSRVCTQSIFPQSDGENPVITLYCCTQMGRNPPSSCLQLSWVQGCEWTSSTQTFEVCVTSSAQMIANRSIRKDPALHFIWRSRKLKPREVVKKCQELKSYSRLKISNTLANCPFSRDRTCRCF